jgi:riboflavin kinase/FMN adenylyltransferase
VARLVRLDGPQSIRSPVAAVGTFDGVHSGHEAVLEAVRSSAAARSGTSVAITFDPHPRRVINPETAPGVLTTLTEKRWRMQARGIDVLGVVPFTQELRQLSPETFVQTFLGERLHVETVVVGYDHEFGRDRSGNLDTMRKLGERFGFDVVSVPPTRVDGDPISSTRIRELISAGDVRSASRLLGGFYPIAGTVEAGEKRGRELGFPTANLRLEDPAKVVPPNGVYAIRAYVVDDAATPDGFSAAEGVVNIGIRPTFNGRSKHIEAHLLDFEGDLYGKTLLLELVERIRDEQAFDNANQLKHKIEQDVAAAREILACEAVTQIRR